MDTGPDWSSKKKLGLPDRIDQSNLKGESDAYLTIKCTKCPYRSSCYLYDDRDGGCGMRKEIYDNLFTKMQFKTEDPITLNRIRMITRYYIELILRRNFGIDFTKSEVQIFKIVMLELDKLSIDKKGDLLDLKQKSILPWEASEDDEKIRQELEEKRKLELELAELRKKKKKAKKNGE